MNPLTVITKTRLSTERIVDVTKTFVKLLFQVQQSLLISEPDMALIAGYLKNNHQEWGHIWKSHPQFNKTLNDIKKLLSAVAVENPTILVHFESNWLLVFEKGVCLPVILQFNPNCRDGLCVAVQHIVTGKAASWLLKLPEYVKDCIEVDLADMAQLASEVTSEAVIEDIRRKAKAIPINTTGKCLTCQEPVPDQRRWCDAECRDMYEKCEH